MFLLFQRYVASVFIWMLYISHMYVACVLPSPPRREPRHGDEHRADTSTPTLALTLLSFTLALAGFTEVENGGAIAAAAFPVLVRAHRLTTVLQIPSTAPPESPPPPPPVA
jgi:hypothetical protein